MNSHPSPETVFLDALPAEEREIFAADPGLGEALAAVLDRARSAWPELSIPDEVLLPFLAERVPPGAGPAGLERLNAPDLYLACGCATGDSAAVALFTSRFFPAIEQALARLELPRPWVEDVRQMVYDKLFVGDAERPAGIRHYKGEGELLTWVRVVAVRQAIDLARKRNRELPAEELPDVVASDDDPEIRFLKRRYGEEFKAAFQKVMGLLTSKERNLLRYQLVSGLTLEQIAGLYQVNRSTVVRWMQKVRDKLLDETRAELSRRLRLTQTEFKSVMRLIQSQLHVSIKRLLG